MDVHHGEADAPSPWESVGFLGPGEGSFDVGAGSGELRWAPVLSDVSGGQQRESCRSFECAVRMGGRCAEDHPGARIRGVVQ